MIKVLSMLSYPLGMIYLLAIMWLVTGHTPVDLLNAITDIINQPLLLVAETLK